ncbi:MAG: hypothetical protein BGO07_02360 [Alphaproteobacteria bacterium 40-19]|nr:MAG: hypothetical protein BGO07_02360 [Alphaproteobacteria bacterium 40-19]
MQKHFNHLIVKKFGGTSVANLECIRLVARLIKEDADQGKQNIVVVSAMAGVTDQLVGWVRELLPANCGDCEYDVVVSSGEQVTSGLVALALRELGCPAQSWLGWQLPIVTNSQHGYADILSINPLPLYQNLREGVIPIISGFQGITSHGRITTLGRGGSDTTAVALAATVQAEVCQIFTDVSGVYSADPSYVPNSKKFQHLSYDDMLTFSKHGAEVLNFHALKWASHYQVPVQVLSTFQPADEGTWVGRKTKNLPQTLKGIAQKKVLSWELPRVSEEAAQKVLKILELSTVPVLSWSFKEGVFRFFTDTYLTKLVQPLMSSPTSVTEQVMITLVGMCFEEFSKKYLPLISTLSLEHMFYSDQTVSLITEEHKLSMILNTLHPVICHDEAI